MTHGRTVAELADRISVAPEDVATWLIEWERRGLVECSWRLADEELERAVRSLALDSTEAEPDDGSWRCNLEEDETPVRCAACGEPLSASVRLRRGRFCSRGCGQRRRRSKRREAA